jgi:hypothetical protein
VRNSDYLKTVPSGAKAPRIIAANGASKLAPFPVVIVFPLRDRLSRSWSPFPVVIAFPGRGR